MTYVVLRSNVRTLRTSQVFENPLLLSDEVRIWIALLRELVDAPAGVVARNFRRCGLFTVMNARLVYLEMYGHTKIKQQGMSAIQKRPKTHKSQFLCLSMPERHKGIDIYVLSILTKYFEFVTILFSVFTTLFQSAQSFFSSYNFISVFTTLFLDPQIYLNSHRISPVVRTVFHFSQRIFSSDNFISVFATLF